MWVMTDRGFYSAVVGDDDPSKVVVRARDRGDLTALANMIPLTIVATPERDYPFRAFVDRKVWAKALDQFVDEMDYGNFKNIVAERQGHTRADLYGQVWWVLTGLQS